jgi:hypothetical protein
VHIYPKSYSDYVTPKNINQEDRYAFTFNRDKETLGTETFIVDSSQYIDIPGKQNYGGHLVIPNLGQNGYWVDFVTAGKHEYSFKRISPTQIEVTIDGLKGSSFAFSSVGELNCINKTYQYGNLNATEIYNATTIVGTYNDFNITFHFDNLTMNLLNWTLVYNNTPYNATNQQKPGVRVQAPTTIPGSIVNIPFHWVVYIDGVQYTLKNYNQTVYSYQIDNCTLYHRVAYNFTIRNESNNHKLNGTITGTFNYQGNTYYLSHSLQSSYKLCIFPNWTSFTGNYSIHYSASGFPQRRY